MSLSVAVVGVGGVGGYFGARLAARGAAKVTFIARPGSAQLAALQTRGLRLFSPNGDVYLEPRRVNAVPAAKEPVDVVLLCVKLFDLRETCAAIGPLLRSDKTTVVIPLQNGTASIDMLAPALPPGIPRCGGTVYVASSIEEPGVFRHRGVHQLIFGPVRGTPKTETMEAFERAGKSAGFDCVLSDDVESEMWRKCVAISSISGLCCITRSPFGVVFSSDALKSMAEAALREAYRVATASGARGLDADAEIPTIFKRWASVPTTRPSMLLDLEHGRRLELPYLSGHIAREGARLGVPTPTHNLICTLLEPHLRGKL